MAINKKHPACFNLPELIVVFLMKSAFNEFMTGGDL